MGRKYNDYLQFGLADFFEKNQCCIGKPIIRLWGHYRGRSSGFVSPQIQQTGIVLRLNKLRIVTKNIYKASQLGCSSSIRCPVNSITKYSSPKHAIWLPAEISYNNQAVLPQQLYGLAVRQKPARLPVKKQRLFYNHCLFCFCKQYMLLI